MKNGIARMPEFEDLFLPGLGLNPKEAFGHAEGEQKRGG
jgi:hypothetical protein